MGTLGIQGGERGCGDAGRGGVDVGTQRVGTWGRRVGSGGCRGAGRGDVERRVGAWTWGCKGGGQGRGVWGVGAWMWGRRGVGRGRGDPGVVLEAGKGRNLKMCPVALVRRHN